MPPELHRQLKIVAFDTDTTMNDLILKAVAEYLSRQVQK